MHTNIRMVIYNFVPICTHLSKSSYWPSIDFHRKKCKLYRPQILYNRNQSTSVVVKLLLLSDRVTASYSAHCVVRTLFLFIFHYSQILLHTLLHTPMRHLQKLESDNNIESDQFVWHYGLDIFKALSWLNWISWYPDNLLIIQVNMVYAMLSTWHE